MKFKIVNINKILIIITLLIIITFSDQSRNILMKATLTLVISILYAVKNRENNLLLIFSFFIFYSVYSIVIGEYYFKDTLGVPMVEVNTPYIYGASISIMLLFITILYLFVPTISKSKKIIIYNNNSVIFYILLIILLLIGAFGVNRGLSSSYTTSITPLYEYSGILFVFGFYTSGDVKFRKILISLLILLFIIQDFYYGGRITSLQLMIVLVTFLGYQKLKSWQILLGALMGIIVNSLVSMYRLTFSLGGITLANILENLKNNLFVFDTVTYSYYASATHVASIDMGFTSQDVRLKSFIEFIKSVLTGSDNIIANVTGFVGLNYFSNLGGGVFPTHFYFWFGIIGVVVSAFIIVFFLKKITVLDSDYKRLALILFVSSSPRWFLYNPLLLFRTQFILLVLYVTYRLGNSLLLTIGQKRKFNVLKSEHNFNGEYRVRK